MTIQTAAASAGSYINLSNSRRTQYENVYRDAAMRARLYDQLAVPIGRPGEFLASSVQVNFLSHMSPETTAISEVADITPQALRDATASVTPTSRAGALQSSETQVLQNFLNYLEMMYKRVGQNMQESIEVLASSAATTGTNLVRAAARASLDAGTTGNRASESLFAEAQTILTNLAIPGFEFEGGADWAAIMPIEAFHDLRTESGSSLRLIGEYQMFGVHLNYEVAKLGPFRIIVSPQAKIFGGAGADNANAVDTTLNSAATALGKTIAVAAVTNLTSWGSGWLVIGTEETGDTHYPQNERVRYVSHTGSTVTIIGEGPNGGLRHDHASATSVRNADSVYTVVFGGPESLAKVYSQEIGEFGQTVGPKRDGIVDQFITLGWKFHGQYGRISEGRILRWEVSSSYDA